MVKNKTENAFSRGAQRVLYAFQSTEGFSTAIGQFGGVESEKIGAVNCNLSMDPANRDRSRTCFRKFLHTCISACEGRRELIFSLKLPESACLY